jgi:FtsP/CotA-like multicopper oxidase with cupredoxin domain
VPALLGSPTFPPSWPTDSREGGVPDPLTVGPDWIAIGTEGGFLPMPTVVPNQPIAWNLDPTTFNFGNVSDHALLLGPAERHDVIVDFSAFAGKTLILYNDAPAAFPALDARNDYYTGAPDRRDTGGVDTTLPGYGPNIRTIMQITVANTTPAPAYDVPGLMAAFAPAVDPATGLVTPGVFEQSQDPIIVGQTAYNEAYGVTFPSNYPAWGVAGITDFSLTFQTVAGSFVTQDFLPKAIHDEMGATFDDYGRMSAKLGLELPKPSAFLANFVMQGYSDPATEIIKLSDQMTPIGMPLEDGTQLWKITHNGVDTHPVHYHLFHVQLVNRVGWDNAIRLPEPTELGWKDTVRTSPLEDTIVALRPIAPKPASLPFSIPNSIRPLNPAIPIGSSVGFSGLDPLGNNITVFNQLANFGWEYVWHCHILSHEENDMMRSVVFAVPPPAPTNLSVLVSGNNKSRAAVLTWVNGSTVDNLTGFTVQRANDPDFLTGLVTVPLGMVTTYTDPIGANVTPMFYRVFAVNTVGSAVTGFPTMTANSGYSNVVPINPLLAPGPLVASLQAGGRVLLTFMDNAINETGFVIERMTTGGGGFTPLATIGPRANTGSVTYTDYTAVAGSTNTYRVKAIAGLVSSAFSNQAFVTIGPAPLAPANLAAVASAANGNKDNVTLTWADNSLDETGFLLQRATDPTFTTGLINISLAANVTTYVDAGLPRLATYYYRIQSFNAGAGSAFINATPFPVVTP